MGAGQWHIMMIIRFVSHSSQPAVAESVREGPFLDVGSPCAGRYPRKALSKRSAEEQSELFRHGLQ
jgi:hypothetical protein